MRVTRFLLNCLAVLMLISCSNDAPKVCSKALGFDQCRETEKVYINPRQGFASVWGISPPHLQVFYECAVKRFDSSTGKHNVEWTTNFIGARSIISSHENRLWCAYDKKDQMVKDSVSEDRKLHKRELEARPQIEKMLRRLKTEREMEERKSLEEFLRPPPKN